MPVFDRDPLSGRWVIHAPARSGRPRRASGDDSGSDRCPFCPGNEQATPPEVLRAPDDGDWLVRVFPNLYPAVEPSSGSAAAPLRVGAEVTGAHEVIVFTPDHDATFADLSDDHAATAIATVLRRVGQHHGSGRVYVQPFINHGLGAGATVEHPHGQLLALDVVPPAVEREERALLTEPCALCGLLRGEAAIAHRAGVAAAGPPWATGPLEMIVGPVEHRAASVLEPAAAGSVLRDALRALRAVAGEVDHNVVFHLSAHHWHLHVSPRTTIAAGFELGSGIRINPSSPADDRDRLRGAWPH